MKRLLLFVPLCLTLACTKPTASSAAATAALVDQVVTPITAPAAAPRVTVLTQDGRRLSVEVELAITPESREKGLMYRKTLPPEAGMLFVFDDDQDHMFWMKNTLIPLDMLFISKEGVVVGIVRDAEPETLTPRAVNHGSRYVLETNAGWAALKGVDVGARVEVGAALPRE